LQDHPAPNHDEPKPHYYPPKKDPSSGGYEYRTDAYEGHESDRRDRREEYDHHYEHRWATVLCSGTLAAQVGYSTV
jgi:hypothetical protein